MEYLIVFVFLLFFALIYYVFFLKRNLKEMSERASLFAKGIELLRSEKIALLENLEEGAFTVDGAGRISCVNTKALLLLGLKNEQFLGKEHRELLQAKVIELGSVANKLVEKVLKEHERMHAHVVLNELLKIHYDLIAIPLPKTHGAILLLKDSSNEQKILDVGKEFIANASHELRTPVTIIRGFAETLKDLDEVSEGMYESILEKIIRNCERMESLVKNLLTLADLENSGPIKLISVDLVALLDDAAEQLLALHPEVQIEQFYNREKIEILGEETLLLLAVLNILKNAVKYSPSPAQIKVVIEEREEEVYLQIEDQGFGIPESCWERIFDRFYTVDKTHSRKLGGAGIGLSMVKIIIDKHNAKIWATSEPNHGSIFHITFLKT